MREVSLAVKAIVSHTAPPPDISQKHNSLWEVLTDWGCCWIWDNLKMVGNDHWVCDAIADNSCTAVADGSYIQEVHLDLCATAFVMECSKGRGKMIGSFAEHSSAANAFQG